MIFIIDIDDTLLLYDNNKKYENIIDKYNSASPDLKEIDILNNLYLFGNTIILYTGRNWDKYEYTKQQMKKFNINYHELVMGKPQGIYIDKDSMRSLQEVKYDEAIFN